MKYTGKLDFNINGEYAIYTGDKYIPISSMLDSMLGDEIKVRILNKNDKEVFQNQGIILREKLTTNGSNQSNLYIYKVNGQDLDSVLWENVDKKITFILDLEVVY
ncbi:hypothetical protein FDC62_07895 [Clostridium botulinum]|uniref:hypothetical protein n=2 Tax=Clostridium botulinum TaxID=1491 RepID=UPI0009926865|nr:hypothetical protein [Clostridium botulinum]NFO98129.1 hypothetical protein [Clostridium botulinum]OOV53125.1 hypothetical protein B1A66_00885 [Clostridium botulinum D/C]OOV58307.1 hypothetical protein B0673_02385 [Clostridium botulinum D/C]OOV59630.1 hypothetical protein B1A67_00930 [Clostridium botulinum D/C]